jgi:hypothetical protein
MGATTEGKMEPRSPKATRTGYSPSPFFFRQTSDSGQVRVVAWTASQSDQRAIFEGLVQLLPGRLDVLLKVKRQGVEGAEQQASDEWKRYHGLVDRRSLLEAMHRCERFIFCDSENQLCVRDPGTSDYVVLDHVGVIYIYSDDDAFLTVLERYGLEERFERLIDDEGYWGQEPVEAEAEGSEFRRLLSLIEVMRSSDRSVQ